MMEDGVDEECAAFDCVREVSSGFPGHDAGDGGTLAMIVILGVEVGADGEEVCVGTPGCGGEFGHSCLNSFLDLAWVLYIDLQVKLKK